MLTLSTSPARTVPVTAPSTPYSLPIYCFSTFTRIGRNRSSSSILGNAFAVAYDIMIINFHSSSCSSQYTYFQRSWQHPPEFIHDQTDLIRHWHISNTSFNVDWSIRQQIRYLLKVNLQTNRMLYTCILTPLDIDVYTNLKVSLTIDNSTCGLIGFACFPDSTSFQLISYPLFFFRFKLWNHNHVRTNAIHSMYAYLQVSNSTLNQQQTSSFPPESLVQSDT